MLYGRVSGSLCARGIERWIALIAFLCSLPSLAIGLQADDYILALERVVPHAAEPITVVFNAPTPVVPWYQSKMRAAEGGIAPPVYTLYVGTQSLLAERYADNGLELYAPRSWVDSPFERIRDFERSPFRSGDRIVLKHLSVEVREVDSANVPTRVRFTFDRSLDDPGLAFRCWAGQELSVWRPPALGARLQLPAVSMF